MTRKKLTKLSLNELAERMPVLSETVQHGFIGGGDGSASNPYTVAEFDQMVADGTWNGGYVDGWGYTFKDVVVTGSCGGSCGGSDSGNENNGSNDNFGSSSGDGNTNEWGGIDSGFWNDFTGGDSGSSGDSGYWWGYGVSGDIFGQMPPGYGGGGGGGGGGWYGGGIDPLKDGVDISNSNHFTLNTTGHSAFNSQLTRILETNSVIKNLLAYFDKGIVHMTFGVRNLQAQGNAVTLALTSYPSPESYHIDFNAIFIDSAGWNNPHNGLDNMGYDFSKARNMEEKLLITLAHEAQHANHVARYHDAMRYANNDRKLAVNFLKESGYSDEFVSIFFTQDQTGTWVDSPTETRNDRLHDYMRKYNHGIIDAALEEYRRDHQN